jgi:hypothetical protein
MGSEVDQRGSKLRSGVVHDNEPAGNEKPLLLPGPNESVHRKGSAEAGRAASRKAMQAIGSLISPKPIPPPFVKTRVERKRKE